MVVAFGGDGTVNEAANGLVGSDTPLCCLPGGRTNVYCRMLGIPTDVVDATEHLLGMAYDWHPRRVDVGRVNDRYFLFSAGVGLDASVVETSTPTRGSRRAWASGTTPGPRSRPSTAATSSARCGSGRRSARRASTASPRSCRTPTPTRTSATGRCRWARAPRWTAATWPASSCAAPARSTSRRSAGGRCPSALALVGHRRVHGFSGVSEVRVSRLDERPLPLQVDGDYIGEVHEAVFTCLPKGMLVVS